MPPTYPTGITPHPNHPPQTAKGPKKSKKTAPPPTYGQTKPRNCCVIISKEMFTDPYRLTGAFRRIHGICSRVMRGALLV